MSAEISAIQDELPLQRVGADGASPAEASGEYWRWCPCCGHELQCEHCKLICPRCHYFMSCSDFG
jgi:hypothetical protein